MQSSALPVCACVPNAGATGAAGRLRPRSLPGSGSDTTRSRRSTRRRRSSRAGSRSRSPPPAQLLLECPRPPPGPCLARLRTSPPAPLPMMGQDQREHQESGGDRRGDAPEPVPARGPADRGPGPGRFLEGPRGDILGSRDLRQRPQRRPGSVAPARPLGCTGCTPRDVPRRPPGPSRRGCRRRSRRGALRDAS